MAGRKLPEDRSEAMVCALRDVFRAKGWDGASLSDLAAAAGLSRASLYHHFPNGKADMAAAALADVEARMAAEILAPLGDRSRSPRARVEAMAAVLDDYYRGGELGCLLGAFAWGARDHGLATRVAAALDSWVAALAAVGVEAGLAPETARRWALSGVSAIQGGLVMAQALGSPEPLRLALSDLPSALPGD